MRLFHLYQYASPNHWNKPIVFAVVIAAFFVLPTSVKGQNYESSPTTLSPGIKPSLKTNKRTREVKRGRVNVRRTAQYEFYDRVEKAARTKKKLLRKLAKPQYSNPLYFGHRTPPKKRPPHKMRFCDECGIRH
jgi:hypothetical protein